ncbi:HNH endonuclease [Actinoplanes sp. NEAU-A11]|uniref:HNH endonuclease n=1 Tax=Actinoplanes aureus TaxID=2792083 RepID=A0A931FV22_9ACTN|nr:HNH endonuclease [Actinoplanes aureus]
MEYFNVFSGFGEVPGVPVGAVFKDRASLVEHRVHINTQWGIIGTRDRGAESVVVSGGYEDDKDYGDLIIYTGHGGRDQDTGKQVDHQSFDARGNAALVTSHVTGVPVRVIRGADAKRKNSHAPSYGYRYDGLFQVESFWQGPGQSGFRVCCYRLVKVSESTAGWDVVTDVASLPSGNVEPGRTRVTRSQIRRARALSLAVKELHDYRCQICDARLTIKGLGYAQGAHIRPVGQPHSGTDTPDNLLCLCPNCHVLFDNGEIVVNDDLTIVSSQPNRGLLRTSHDHVINLDHLRYHRDLFR